MIETFRKLLFSRQLNFGKGSIRIFNRPLIMHPVEFLASFQMYLEKELGYEKSKKILIEGFKKGGASFTENYVKNYGIRHKQDIIKWSMDLMTMSGWGDYELVNLDMKNSRFIFRIKNSPFTELIKSKKPVDHIIVGLITGVAEYLLFNRPMILKEIKCQAKGDPFCEIIGEPKKK